MKHCPITGEPLLNPGQQISRTAANRLTTQTRGLYNLIENLAHDLSAHQPENEGHRGTRPTSTPPLNLILFHQIDTHRDTIHTWAAELLHHTRPGTQFKNGDWNMIEQIYRDLTHKALTWEHAPQMVNDVLNALHAIDQALTPKTVPALTEDEKRYAAGALLHRHLTISAACDAVRLLTDTPLPKNTVYSWVKRGHITPKGNPKRYLIQDLIDLQQKQE